MTTFTRLETDDLELILGTLKEFTDRNAPFEQRLEWDRRDVCPAEVVREMLSPDVGLHLPFLPSEYGGMGGGAYDIYRLSSEFAQIDLGLATSMLAVALGTDPIRVGCTEAQKERWLPRIAGEGLIVAYAVTEPEAGSNVQNIQTQARPIADENGRVTHYSITGVNQFISNGSIADLYTVLAKAPDGPSFFQKLAQQQHALFECATSVVEMEVAAALVRSAGISGDPLLQAQARVFAADVALSVPVRLTKLFAAAGVEAPSFDFAATFAFQSHRLADLDFIARAITLGI